MKFCMKTDYKHSFKLCNEYCLQVKHGDSAKCSVMQQI